MAWRMMAVRVAVGAAVALSVCMALLLADGLTDETVPADVAVVLGNQVHPDGTPSARLAARLDRAVELVEQDRVQWVIVSGGTGREGVPEGDAMKRYMVANGVPEALILVDNMGVDTWATARNARAIMQTHDLKSAVVVSQYFHIARTRLAFRKHGLAVGGTHARFFELRDLYSIVRELPAWLKYALKPAA